MAILLGVISVCAMTSDLIYSLVIFQIPLLLIWSVGASSSNGTVPSCFEKCFLDPWPFQFLLMLLLIFITSAVHLISYWFNNVCSSILTSYMLVLFSLWKLWELVFFWLDNFHILLRVLVPYSATQLFWWSWLSKVNFHPFWSNKVILHISWLYLVESIGY